MDHLQNELKKEFQIERMILFSDAVFAIALTLLVIDLKVPEIPKEFATDEKLLVALDHLIPKFFGFIVSFLFIGAFWIIHHRLFGYVINYDRRLLVLNLAFLFSIVLMPFSTAFFSEYFFKLLKTPVIFYSINIFFLAALNSVLWIYIGHPKNELSKNLPSRMVRYHIIRSNVMPVLFLVAVLVYEFVPSKYSLIVVAIVMFSTKTLVTKYGKKIKRSSSPQH